MKEDFYIVWGNLWDPSKETREEFRIFIRGIDNNHAVMMTKDYLRRNAPSRDGKLVGKIIIEGVEKREVD